jgi:SAM-dependent methyltransferase
MNAEIKKHWETIYQTKQPNEVSWTEEKPSVSLALIHSFNPSKSAKIIDIGGGDSKLVDYLLAEGYSDLSVLDISEAAIDRAKKRLGNKAKQITWIVQDVLDFKPKEQYAIWHDRAAFHFQTEEKTINSYLNLVSKAVSGNVIVGTFSTDGPTKCSGLDVKQYDETGMKSRFESRAFKNILCKRENHMTPMGAIQNFVFCLFKKV